MPPPWTLDRATAYHDGRRDGQGREPPMTTIDETEPPAEGWWVQHDAESFGPYTEAQMRSFVTEGRIVAETPVRHGEEGNWQPAARHPVFGPIFTALASEGPPRPEQMRGEGPDLSGTPGGPSAQSVGPAGVPVGITTPYGLPPGETTTMAHVVYALYVLNAATGIAGIIGLIIAYLKRRDVTGTWLETHYQWQIRTFWIGIVAVIVGLILMKVFIGILIIVATGIWYIWRIIKGWTRLGSNRPLEDPTGWV
jgi:uncharacterized membrane protein